MRTRDCGTPRPISSHPPPSHPPTHHTPLRLSTHTPRKQPTSIAYVCSSSGDGDVPEIELPKCIFKKYAFTQDPPPETQYIFNKVPTCERDLSDSVLMRPMARRQWFVCLQELESLAQESLDRRAARLGLPTPSGLPIAYIADRMDIDDPLWGYQVRSAKTGWLQGFITLTVFTTWTHYFEWNSLAPASGMAAARVANALIGRPDPALYCSEGGETVQQVAARVGVRAAEIVAWNQARYGSISCNSRVQPGTALYVMDPTQIDRQTVAKTGETPKKVAARLGLDTNDLLQLNSERQPGLTATSKLKPGDELMCRDRKSEPEVFLPTNAQKRELDMDGSLAAELARQKHYGDPVTTGVVWPRLVEIGLLAGLGCGKLLVQLALQELSASGNYDFAVLQATMASVSFYEELGFVRVGAVARYLPEGTDLAANPVQGYRHWACADESQLDQFGDTSYMMALKLSGLKTGSNAASLKIMQKRLVKEWPAVQPGFGKGAGKGHGKKSATSNTAGIVGGSAMQVGDMSLNMAEGDDARLQLRFEVEKVLDERGTGSNHEYLVKWRHCSAGDATYAWCVQTWSSHAYWLHSGTCYSHGLRCPLLPAKRPLPLRPRFPIAAPRLDSMTHNPLVRSWENSSADCLHSEVGQAALSRYLKSHHRKRHLGLPKGRLPKVHLTYSWRCRPRVARRAGSGPLARGSRRT